MRHRSALLVGLVTAAVIGGTAGPAAAEDPLYPVICVQIVLPDGTPLPEVCIPDPR